MKNNKTNNNYLEYTSTYLLKNLIRRQYNKMKRDIGLDFIKCIACYMVIILHTVCYGLKDNEKTLGLIFYYVGIYAIPLFFMVNGYLQLRKKSINIQYCIKKIGKMFIITLLLNCILNMVTFFVKHSSNNVFVDVFNSLFLQKGFYSQLWFFGALSIIYVFLPFINMLFNKDKKVYLTFTGILILICVIIDILNIRNHMYGISIIKDIIKQPFRLWTWLSYFCIGGCIARLGIPKNKLFIKIGYILPIIIVIMAFFLSDVLYGNLYAENYYDNFLVILSSIELFLYIKTINIEENNVLNKIINFISPLVMGIYIFQMIIVKVFNMFILTDNNFYNFVFSILIFIICSTISKVISRFRKLNWFINL